MECQHTVDMGLNPNQKCPYLKKCQQHMEDTVNTEYQLSEDTVKCLHMVDSVVTRSLCPNPNPCLWPNLKNRTEEDMVNTEFQHTEDTVNTECLHTEHTVNTEYQRTEDTVNCHHMEDTVITRSLHLKKMAEIIQLVVLICARSITILCVDLMEKLMLMNVLL